MRGERLTDERHDHPVPPGSFWKQPHSNSGSGVEGDRGVDWQWCVCDPNGLLHTLATTIRVREFKDGSISVPLVRDLAHTVEVEGWELRKGLWIDRRPKRPVRVPQQTTVTLAEARRQVLAAKRGR